MVDQSLASIMDELIPSINTAVRRLALGIVVRNIPASPVDTGRFRSNWTISIDAPSNTSSIDVISESAAISKVSMESKGFDIMKNSSMHIVNALPYAKRLAMGYSSQAPAGWLDINIRNEIAEMDSSSGA
jgi:hypothetical protein